MFSELGVVCVLIDYLLGEVLFLQLEFLLQVGDFNSCSLLLFVQLLERSLQPGNFLVFSFDCGQQTVLCSL